MTTRITEIRSQTETILPDRGRIKMEGHSFPPVYIIVKDIVTEGGKYWTIVSPLGEDGRELYEYSFLLNPGASICYQGYKIQNI